MRYFKLKKILTLLFVFLVFSMGTNAQKFELFTGDIISGESYLIASEPTFDESKIADSFEQNKLIAVSTDNAHFQEFKIIKDGTNGYKIMEGQYYLYNKKNSSDLAESQSISASSAADKKYYYWDISYNESTQSFTIKNKGDGGSGRLLLFSKYDNYFKAYSSMSFDYTPVYLYKKVLAKLSSPVYSQLSTRFTGELSISLTANEGETIYYTVDGSTPNENSNIYSTPITISKTTSIKAIAMKGEDFSTVASATYTYIEPIAVRFGGNLNLGTFFADYPTFLPNGVKAYTISSKNMDDGKVSLVEYISPDGTLPANVPFILKGSSSDPINISMAMHSCAQIVDYDTDFIHGTTCPESTPALMSSYVLGYGETSDGESSEFGFCKYIGTDKIPANRVYLTIDIPFTLLKESSEIDKATSLVIADEVSEDGLPAGNCAGKFDSKNLRVLKSKISSNSPLMTWTFTPYSSGFKITRSDTILSCKDYNTLQNGKLNEYPYWQLEKSTTHIGAFKIINTKFKTSYNLAFGDYFKMYSSSNNTVVYLFIQKESTEAAVKLFSFNFSKPEGIPTTKNIKVYSPNIYNVCGQRKKHIGKGLNIMQGKKIYSN